MNPDTNDRLIALEEKIDAIWQSVEKTRKYFLISMWTTVILFVLPLLLLLLAIPMMLRNITAII